MGYEKLKHFNQIASSLIDAESQSKIDWIFCDRVSIKNEKS